MFILREIISRLLGVFICGWLYSDEEQGRQRLYEALMITVIVSLAVGLFFGFIYLVGYMAEFGK